MGLIDGYGQTLTYYYDDAQRLTGYSDTLGNRVSYTLDAAGNRLSETITDSNQSPTQIHQYVYDKLSRLLSDIGSNGQVSSYHYDANDNLLDQLNKQQQTGSNKQGQALHLTFLLSFSAYFTARLTVA